MNIQDIIAFVKRIFRISRTPDSVLAQVGPLVEKLNAHHNDLVVRANAKQQAIEELIMSKLDTTAEAVKTSAVARRINDILEEEQV